MSSSSLIRIIWCRNMHRIWPFLPPPSSQIIKCHNLRFTPAFDYVIIIVFYFLIYRLVQMWRNHTFSLSLFNISTHSNRIKLVFSEKYVSRVALHIIQVSLFLLLHFQFYNWNTGPLRNHQKRTNSFSVAWRTKKFSSVVSMT